jgi:predicted ribosomally synthesized peptide with SipW-like signal peptide
MRFEQQTVVSKSRRSRDRRKIVLSIALILGALGALIGGAFATFTSSATAGPQAITSGTIKLAVGAVNDVATGATNIAAGDTIAREADLESTVKIGGAETAAVGSLESTAAALTPLNSLGAGGQDFLVFTITLPATAPGNIGKVAACSGTSGGTEATEDLQGCSSTLTYTFQATQRNAIAQ